MDLPSPPLDSPKRLAIMILLERHHSIIFSELYSTLQLSRGSVDSHLRKLEDYGLVVRDVEFVNTSSQVMVTITQQGMQALRVAKAIWADLLDL